MNITETNNDILNVIKLIYIMTNEDFDSTPNEQLINKLFSEILPKCQVDSLSKFKFNIESLFIQEIFAKFTPNRLQLEKLNSIIKDSPHIIHLNGMLRSNKALHYVTFSIKELVEFFNRKTETGELLLNCKKAALNLNQFMADLEKLK
jgi:hypothetical protein